MTEKRYQVFVSSTFADLTEERQEVMHALLELDCIPSGMELFPAADETQWELIKRVIDDCDYYILVLAGRYGSLGPKGKSYTQMEYEYALSKGKPTIAFLHKEPGKISADRTESSEQGREKLKAFRTSVEQKLCKMWTNPQDLGSVVSRSLIQLIKRSPAVGWVRANELASTEAASEILKLRNLVAELQSQAAEDRLVAPKGTDHLSQGNDVFTLKYNFEAISRREANEDFESSVDVTWNDIFAVLSPLMLDGTTEIKLLDRLTEWLDEENSVDLLEDVGPSFYKIGDIRVSSNDFQTIKIQFRALGLIEQSKSSNQLKTTVTKWTLTPYGDQVMTNLRAIPRSSVRADEADNYQPPEERELTNVTKTRATA